MDTTGVERGCEKYAFYASQHIAGCFRLFGFIGRLPEDYEPTSIIISVFHGLETTPGLR
jgi:hypothetical protein